MKVAILELLSALIEGPSSAADILGQVEKLRPEGKKPSVASFYRNLNTVVSGGMVDISDGETASGNRGRPAQLYTITDHGVQEMRQEALRLRDLADMALSELTETAG